MELITPLFLLLPFLFLKKGSGVSLSSSGNISGQKFVPNKQSSFQNELDYILAEVEAEIYCPGLHDFFMGVAWVESRYIPSAIRYESIGYKLVENKKKTLAKNPWVNDKYMWNWTGGLFQLFPVNALLTSDKTAVNLNPDKLFDPYYSIAFAIDFAYRLAGLDGSKFSVKTWIDIRYGWASLSVLSNKSEKKAQEVKGRIITGIQKSGGDINVLNEKFNFNKYSQDYQFAGLLKYINSFRNS